jgi:hypothetical protein
MLLKFKKLLSVVELICNLSIWEAKVRKLQV